MATLGYNIQALGRAVEILTRGEGDLRDRIRKAAPDLLTLEPEVCPSSWRRDIRWIQRRMSSRPRQTYDGRPCFDYDAAIMYRVTAKKIADRIWRLFHKCQNRDDSERVETEDVDASVIDNSVSFSAQCPLCGSEIRMTLRPTKQCRCKCRFSWRLIVTAVGVKRRSSGVPS